jgi:PAS domain S-box-containing protein
MVSKLYFKANDWCVAPIDNLMCLNLPINQELSNTEKQSSVRNGYEMTMNFKINKKTWSEAELRRSAEEQLILKTIAVGTAQADENTVRLLQELQVHQIELEMQNEELRHSRQEAEELLEKYTDLYDFAPVGYFTLDRNGTINSVNLRGASLVGVARGRLLGQRFGLLVADEHRNKFKDFLGTVFINQDKTECEVALQNGENRSVIVLLEAMATVSGQECGIILKDITVRKQTEETLRNSEERYRRLFEMESGAILLIDWETGRIMEANTSAFTMFGYTPEEFMKLTPADLSAEPADTIVAIREKKEFVPVRFYRTKDGTQFPVEITSRFFEYQGRLVHVADIRDISDRLRTEKLMLSINLRLSDMNEHLLLAQEQERLTISRDIHDDIGQNLTVLKLDLQMIELRKCTDSSVPDAALISMRENIDHIVARVQQIAANLRPPLLDNAGLTAAIEWQIDEIRKRSDIEFFVMLNEDADLLDQQISNLIIRVFQEGLTNIVRHSRANEVCVSLCKRDNNLILEIADNGCGITPEQKDSPRAYGLMGMHERARSFGGSMEISAIPAGGTTLSLSIPLIQGEAAP